MKKPLVLAALAAMILVGAAYPDFDKPDADDNGYAQVDERDAPRHYRPCRSRRDDNCIQLYERGVRLAYARWLGDGDPGYRPVRMASADRRGHRWHAAHGTARHAAAAPRWQPSHRARRIAQARPRTRFAYVAQARCAPAIRRPQRTAARAAPAPVRRPAPAAPPARRLDHVSGSGVRGM